MAFIPAAVVIKSMTFRRPGEGGLLLMTAGMRSHHLLHITYSQTLLHPPKAAKVYKHITLKVETKNTR